MNTILMQCGGCDKIAEIKLNESVPRDWYKVDVDGPSVIGGNLTGLPVAGIHTAVCPTCFSTMFRLKKGA